VARAIFEGQGEPLMNYCRNNRQLRRTARTNCADCVSICQGMCWQRHRPEAR